MKFLNNFNPTYENGRSIVEMLGVLAIIGVLSVGGIMGYTTAMNKYKANDLLQAINLRAHSASQKYMKGAEGEQVSLSDISAAPVQGMIFDSTAYPGTDHPESQFEIALTQDSPLPDPEVCKQMRQMVGENSLIRDMDEDCAIFTFNNDLSATLYPSDYLTEEECEKVGFHWCENQKKSGYNACAGKNKCCVGEYLEGEECKPCKAGGVIVAHASECNTGCPSKYYYDANDALSRCIPINSGNFNVQRGTTIKLPDSSLTYMIPGLSGDWWAFHANGTASAVCAAWTPGGRFCTVEELRKLRDHVGGKEKLSSIIGPHQGTLGSQYNRIQIAPGQCFNLEGDDIWGYNQGSSAGIICCAPTKN